MKIKIMKRENDIIIEYAREKNPDVLRYKILEYLTNSTEGKIIIYIDTNSKVEEMPIAEIENALLAADINYKCVAVENSKRGMFGLSQIFKANKKNKNLTEHIVLAEITKETDIKEIYHQLLSNYDYAVGIGTVRPISELILMVKSNIDDALFNKEVFCNTAYDSIVLQRMRMDSPYDDFAVFADTL